MSYLMKSAIIIGFAASVGTAAITVARADVMRIAIVEADNEDDFKSNVAMLPTFADLLKKGGEHKSIATSSVWGSAAELAKVTGSDEWKAAAGKLKRKSYTTEMFEVAP